MTVVNYIAAPNFETSSFASAGGQSWTTFGGGVFGGSASFSRSTTAKKTGTYGLRIEIDDGPAGARLAGITLPATTAAKVWTFSFELTLGGSLYSPYVDIYTSGGTSLASRSLSTQTRVSVQFTQQPGVTAIKIEFSASPGSGQNKSIGLDNLRLTAGTDSTYIDGNTTGYSWAGTANASETVDAPPTPDPAVPTNTYNYWRSPHPSGTGWAKETTNAAVVDNGSSITAQLYAASGAVNSVISPQLDISSLQRPTTAWLSLDITTLAYTAGSASNYTSFTLDLIQYDASGTRLTTDSFTLDKTTGRQAFSFITRTNLAKVALRVAASGDATARWLYATLDNVRIDVRTDTAYVGGDTTGYLWQGTANASITVLGAKQLSASASIPISGGATQPTIVRPMSASARIPINGTAAADKTGMMTASATIPVTGSAVLVRNGAMAASASITINGSAPLYAIVPISASASIPMGGSASATIAVQTVASAHIPIGGTAELTVMEIVETSASAHIPIGGTAELSIGLQLSAHATIPINGSAQLEDAVPQGAFADFAIYGTTAADTDPLMLGRGATNAGISTGASGADWNRVHAEFHAPAASAAWPRAAYAAVGFVFTGMATGTYQELANVQVELSADATSPGPTDYIRPQLVRPLVVADKVNYVGPAADWIDVWFNDGNYTTTSGGASPVPGDTWPVQTYARATDSDGLIAGWVETPPAPGPAVFSVYVKLGDHTDDAWVQVTDPNMNALGFKLASEFTPDENGWRRVVVPYTQPETKVFVSVEVFPADPRVFPEAVTLAAPQLEPGYAATPYAQLAPGSRDWFYWHMGTDTTKGQFLYSNIDERVHLLVDALEEYAPIDVTVGAPEFGIHPHLE